jgi:U3 small nucleolar RNA-associated protein 25
VDMYEADVIVASPLALATRLAEGKSDGADFLSSIEICVLFRTDVLQMQNWAHVETVMQHVNRMPKQQHGTDIMRVRWGLLVWVFASMR